MRKLHWMLMGVACWTGLWTAPALGQLRWVADGSGVLVQERWLLNPGSGNWTPLPRWPGKEVEEEVHAAVSPAGSRVLLQRQHSFVEGPMGGDLGPVVEIPIWIRPSSAEEAIERDDRIDMAFWLDEQRILVEQIDRMARADVECKIWDVASRSWSAAPGCVTGDFHLIWRVDAGKNGEIAVLSSGEGHPGLSVARYDLQKGQQALEGAPELNLYPFGVAEAVFLTDGSGVLYATPCLLERKEPPPCLEPDGELRSEWRIYGWREGKELQLERSGLAEGTLPSPAGKQIAWEKPGQVCVETTGKAPVCHELPKRS